MSVCMMVARNMQHGSYPYRAVVQLGNSNFSVSQEAVDIQLAEGHDTGTGLGFFVGLIALLLHLEIPDDNNYHELQ